TAGLGGLSLFERAAVGVNDSTTFLTSNVGGGIKWYAGRWGLRGDYRFIAVQSKDDAPASACMFIPSIHTLQAGAAGTRMETMSFRKLVQWIREEFEGTPDLRLTTREAAAFLGLDLAVCERVLSQLLRAGFLTQDPDGRFAAVPVTM